MNRKKICMIVQDKMVKGGIASVVNGYRGSILEEKNEIFYVESYKDGNKIEKTIKAIFSYFNFLYLILNKKIDIIHIHSSFGASFYRKIPFIYIGNLFNKKIINHIHGADFEKFYINANNIKKKIIIKVYNKCEYIVSLSEEWKDSLALIVPKERIKIVENYSIIKNKDVIKENYREVKKQILFLGEIGKRKGCYDIPDVIEKVVKDIPDVKFIMGGTGDIENIKKILDKKNLSKNVEFVGWVRGDKKDMLLRQSDVFFLPSYNEGMPMAILDAMGYGLPIISTNVGGIPKIVKSEFNGYLCNPGDKDGFAKSIINLLNDRDMLLRFGRNSYKIVEEKYSFEKHISLIQELYTNI